MTTKAGFVALVGKPNAGKSTLMNTVLGLKLSIVTPKPQTTRKPVLGIYSDDDVQIVFLDTPGMLTPKYEMQRSMMGYVEESLADADTVAVLIDLEKYKGFDKYFNEQIRNKLSNLKKPVIAVLNKLDRLKDRKMALLHIDELNKTGLFRDIVPISALKATSIDIFIDVLSKYIPESEFYYDPELLSTQSERFFVSEIIREEVFRVFHEEIPYSSEVYISQFKEREEGKWYIAADIIVERNSQKKILVGSNGEMVKKIGEKARSQIEDHLQNEIFLELFVKVRPKWRNNKNMLKSFGY